MKILYITTISNTINSFLKPQIKLLYEMGNEIDIACKINMKIDEDLKQYISSIIEIPFDRKPLSFRNLKALRAFKKIAHKGEYDLIHTHTPIASFISRIAFRKAKNVKILYTAHGFHFHKNSGFFSWLFYYPIEKYCSKYTDIIFTMNNEDYNLSSKKFKNPKTIYIPGIGFDKNRFNNLKYEHKSIKEKFGIPENAIVLLSVGELNNNKNHAIIIKALSYLKSAEFVYIICGEGNKKKKLMKIANSYNIIDKIIFAGYINDINTYYKQSDIFLFPSKREGLPLSLLEAMDSGLPVVCSAIRGNEDLIDKNKGGYLIENNNEIEYANAIYNLIKSKEIRDKMSKYNISKIENYTLEKVLSLFQDVIENGLED